MHPKFVILTAVAFFLGYMANEALSTPKPVRLDSVPFCLHSEYSDMRALRDHKEPIDLALIDIGPTVRVWVPCPDSINH